MPTTTGLLGKSLLETFAQLENEKADFSEVPVINIGGLQSPVFADRLAVAEKVRDACIRVGFFYVTSHGVDEEVIQKCFAASKRFFALPMEDKMDLLASKNEAFKGYESLNYGAIDPNTKGDVKEAFNFGYEPKFDLETPASVPWHMYPGLQGPNVWPTALDEDWKKDIIAYYSEVLKLGRRLLKMFALVLDLPETYFDEDFLRPGAIMRLLRYPASRLDPENPGIGAHRDYECFTILCQDGTNGLQVQTRAGEWIEATPKPGTFVVNIANFLERWTNDVFRSTMHRVYNVSGNERYSFPMFIGPNYTTKVNVIHTCVSEERPARYGEVIAGEHVAKSLYNARKKTATEAVASLA